MLVTSISGKDSTGQASCNQELDNWISGLNSVLSQQQSGHQIGACWSVFCCFVTLKKTITSKGALPNSSFGAQVPTRPYSFPPIQMCKRLITSVECRDVVVLGYFDMQESLDSRPLHPSMPFPNVASKQCILDSDPWPRGFSGTEDLWKVVGRGPGTW